MGHSYHNILWWVIKWAEKEIFCYHTFVNIINHINMKSYHICLLALLAVLVSASYKNTTTFWTKQLNETSLHYHAYAGTHLPYCRL